ncbi:MAG: FAD-dependent oxidoreductase [Coriobacteriales bacterium]|nr:FAD-dependent oxidoreductase [Coriobacteriales bacterium]
MSNNMSRRNFLAGTGVAAAAMLGAGSAFAASSGDTSGAMAAAEALGTKGGSIVAGADVFGRPYNDEYVVDIANGIPRWSFEIAPEPIPADQIAEVIEDDIIVIGSGMAGLCVAASAAEQGGSVTLFSASSQPISRGGSNFSAYNKVIEEYGIPRLDPVDFFWREEKAASFSIDQQMWMRGYNNSEEAMNWVIDIARDADVEVFLERDNINEGGPDYAIGFGAKGDDSGSASTGQQNAVEAVEEFALAHGAKIMYDIVAKQLIREGDGPVTGVIGQKEDGSYIQFNGKYIVMATGGFCADKNMVAKYMPQVLPLVGLDPVEVDYNTGFALTGIFPGDGQKMGLWVGASWQHCTSAPIMQSAWAGSYEPLGFHQGLNVNMNTERYQREDMTGPYSANHLLAQPGHIAWGIWTANFAQEIIDNGHEWYFFGNKYDVPAMAAEDVVAMWDSSWSYTKADTLEELAGKIGLDPEKLVAVVERYNECVAAGEDLDFHKDPSNLIEIKPEGPFYAARNYAMFMSTEAGLNTNCNLQVCDANNMPIPGLFNVGQMIGNMYANNYNFAIPGNSYGINCITFGYLLGRDLAAGKF